MFCIYYIVFFISGILAKPSNIILFLTDDQDLLLNGMLPMVKTNRYLGNEGVTFANMFVNAPICCPSRSSILTGSYPHNTGVKNNSYSGNCAGEDWVKYSETKSIASSLEKFGFVNFYAGKYLNQYGTKKAGGGGHVPKGYHWWYGLIGNSKYYNYSLSINGTNVFYGDSSSDYLTDIIVRKAIEFLNQNFIKSRPFFMVLAPPAPHAPFTPAQRHNGVFPNVKVLRTPAFNYTPTQKHWLLQLPPLHLPTDVTTLDNIQEHRLESLLAVDDMVETIIHKLLDIQELDNTYLIYTSDNGFHIGQFGQPWDKRQPYDTDIRVPLIIRGPGLKKKFLSYLPVQSVDLAPTILEMAGLKPPNYMDGQSVLEDLKLEQTGRYRMKEKNILIEYNGEGNSRTNSPTCSWASSDDLAECVLENWCKCQDSRNNTYSCVRQMSQEKDFLYCRMKDSQNFTEAYDMTKDRYQLKNIFSEMSQKEITKYENILQKLLICKGINCR